MWPFKKKRVPVAGEKWRLDMSDGSPWENKSDITATILEVRKGWVRYSYGSVDDYRHTKYMFCRLFIPEEK